jgi:hypothetical protein
VWCTRAATSTLAVMPGGGLAVELARELASSLPVQVLVKGVWWGGGGWFAALLDVKCKLVPCLANTNVLLFWPSV